MEKEVIQQAILGTLFLKPTLLFEVKKILNETHFTGKYSEVYKCIVECDDKKEKWDANIIANIVTGVKEVDVIGLMSMASIHNFQAYLLELKKNYVKSGLQSLLTDGARAIGSEDPDKVLSQIIKSGELILNDKTSGVENDALKDHVKIYRNNVIENPKGKTIGIQTGFKKFDEYLGGVHLGDQLLIGALSGVGKTTFLINLIISLAKQNIPTGVISLEMTVEQLINTLISYLTGISTQVIRNGVFTVGQKEKITKALDEIEDWPIYIADSCFEYLEIENKVREWKIRYGIKAVGYDYAQMISFAGYKKKTERIEEVSRRLKLLAMPSDCNVCNILLTQLTYDNGFYKPKYSIQLYEDSDSALYFIEDVDETKNRGGNVRVLTCHGKKNRHGPKGFEIQYIVEGRVFNEEDNESKVNAFIADLGITQSEEDVPF